MHNSSPLILPQDKYNQALVDHVHPHDWKNPEITSKPYTLVIIGAGTAGLVTAAIAATLGAKVALIEKHLMGGDCLNFGCVPSKSLLHGAKMGHSFEKTMENLRRQRASISRHDSAQRFQDLGADVFLGSAKFIKEGIIEITTDDKTQQLRYKKAVICTGARAAIPPIPGLDQVDALTNESIFSLTEKPDSLGIIGSGPIGIELAQAFARLGIEITVFDQSSTILPRENPKAAVIVQEALSNDGVNFCLGSALKKLEKKDGGIRIHYEINGQPSTQTFKKVLVAAGRAPNVKSLNLEAVGVNFDDRQGVVVDDFLQTTNTHIYAAGDICFPYKFTHTADVMAQIVIQNALFPHPLGLGKRSTNTLIIPWCTYTQPEIAHVGHYAAELNEKNIDFDSIKINLDAVDRAILDESTQGFIEIHLAKNTDRILGATLVAENAGDIISSISLLMSNKLGLSAIGKTIFPYPTQAEILKKVVAHWQKSKFTARKKKLLTRLFRWG